MPEEEHKLTIQIETNAKQAARDIEDLDKAQQSAASSGQKLQETERHGSTVDARKIRQRAKFMRAYLKDVTAIRKQTEKTNAVQRKERDLVNSTRISLKGLAASLGGRNLVMGVAAVAAGVMALKKTLDAISSGAKDAMTYKLAEEATGENPETIQALERIVTKHGGNRESAISSIAALQQLLAKINMGTFAPNDEQKMLLGDFLMARPGMTWEEYAAQIGERLRQLDPARAMMAGRSIGLTPDMILSLREGRFLENMAEGRKAAPMPKGVPEKAQEVNQRYENTKRDIRAITDAIAVAVGDAFLPEKSGIAGLAEAVYKIVNPVEFIKTQFEALKRLIDYYGGIKTPSFKPPAARAYETISDPDASERDKKNAETVLQMELFKALSGGLGQLGANTRTPLNSMNPYVAFRAGYASAGGGDNILNLGGITINAPSGEADDIRESVIEAGNVVLAAFADLDRMTAGPFNA